MLRTIRILLVLSLLLLALPAKPAHADIAPPDFPPGTNPVPGSEGTQVRMEAERVVMTITGTASPYPAGMGEARTTAEFDMRNLGDQSETMLVRFPLTFYNGRSDGWGVYPEIRDFTVEVGSAMIPWERIYTTNDADEDHPTPWAAFTVTFPPGELVKIKVGYTHDGHGELSYAVYRYILNTGAGWNGTIGSATITVRLPYDATSENILVSETGFGATSNGALLRGSTIVWQFEELEPTSEDDITIALVTPAAWEWVLTERDNVTRNPNDGEAWGRLGKACKNAITQRKSLRDDPGGLALYAEADRAYARALELLPNDSLWHTGYADLLWQEWYWTVFWSDPTDVALLHKAVSLLARSLELDPKNQKSKDLLDEIGYSVPEYVLHVGDAVDLLILTATPVHVTRTPWSSPTPLPTKTKWPTSVLPPTYTPMAEATEEPTSTASATPAPPTPTTAATTVEPAAVSEPTPAKSGGIPFCGGAVILPLAMGLVLLLKQRKDTRHLHYKERSG